MKMEGRGRLKIYFSDSNNLTDQVTVSYFIDEYDEYINVMLNQSEKLIEIKRLLDKPGRKIKRLFINDEDILKGREMTITDISEDNKFYEFKLIK